MTSHSVPAVSCCCCLQKLLSHTQVAAAAGWGNMAYWPQLRLLLWKNLTFRRRQTVSLGFSGEVLLCFSSWLWVGDWRREERESSWFLKGKEWIWPWWAQVRVVLIEPYCLWEREDVWPGRNVSFSLCYWPGMSSDPWNLAQSCLWPSHSFLLLQPWGHLAVSTWRALVFLGGWEWSELTAQLLERRWSLHVSVDSQLWLKASRNIKLRFVWLLWRVLSHSLPSWDTNSLHILRRSSLMLRWMVFLHRGG